MPIIPRYKGHVQLSNEAPAVRGDIGSAGLEYQAIASFGESAFRAGELLAKRAQEMQEEDDSNYVTEQTLAFENDAIALTEEEMSLSGKAALNGSERISKRLDDKITEYVSRAPVQVQTALKEKLGFRRNDRLNQIAAHEAGQRRVYETQLAGQAEDTYRKSAFNSPNTLPTYLGYAKNDLGERYTPEVRSNIIAAAVDGMILHDLASAKDYFEIVRQDMTADHQKYYEKAIDTALKNKAKDEELEAKKIKADLEDQEKSWTEEDTEQAGQLYRDKALTYEFVDKMRIKDKAKWYERVEKQLKDEETKEAGDAEAEMRRRISMKPDSIESKAEIWDLLDKGVPPKTVQTMVADWENKKKGDAPDRDARQARLHDTLKSAKNHGLFDDPDIDEEKDGWLKSEEVWRDLARQVDAYFKANPNATDRDVQGFEEELLRPFKERDAKGRIRKILDWIKGASTVEPFTEQKKKASEGLSNKAPEGESEGGLIEPGNKETQGADAAKRAEAIRILRENKKLINEETIKLVMDRMQ